MLTDKVMYFLREAAGIIDGTGRHLVGAQDTILDSNSVIVLTEGWCLVYNTSTILCSNIRVVNDTESPVFVL